MTFKPVGESDTTIKVNGSTQGTWTQSDNSTYDVSVSENKTIRNSILQQWSNADMDETTASVSTTLTVGDTGLSSPNTVSIYWKGDALSGRDQYFEWNGTQYHGNGSWDLNLSQGDSIYIYGGSYENISNDKNYIHCNFRIFGDLYESCSSSVDGVNRS